MINYKEYREIIKQERQLLNDFYYQIEKLRDYLIKNEDVSKINAEINRVERKAKKFSEIDKKRANMTTDLCKKVNIQNDVKEVIDFLSKNNSDTAVELAEFIDELKNFTILLDSLRDVIGFQSNFNDMIRKLINIDKSGKLTYNKKGYNHNLIDQSKKGWRG